MGGVGLLLLLRASTVVREDWFVLWVGACGLQSTVALLNALRPVLPVSLGVVGNNDLFLLSLGLLWAAIRRLGHRAAPAWAILAAPMIWVGAVLIPGFVESPMMRLGLLLPMIFVLMALAALECWNVYRSQTIRAALDLAVLLGALAASLLPRIFGLIGDSEIGIHHGNAMAQAVLASALPFLALSTAHERCRLADAVRTEAAGRLSSLGEMAAGMAHEVNTPLAIIGLAAENAADALEDGDPDARRYALDRLRLIEDSVQRARTVIDHVRIFARGADPAAEDAPSSLALVLEGAASLTQGALRPHGIALDLALPPELLRVPGAVVPLEQVFSNLVLNAKDAICASGRGHGVIQVRTTSHDDRIEVEVEDNGGGIPDAVMPRIFEPFFSTKPPGQGTGLGLSIVHGTMRKIGGTVTARNGDDGACFTLVFPHAA